MPSPSSPVGVVGVEVLGLSGGGRSADICIVTFWSCIGAGVVDVEGSDDVSEATIAVAGEGVEGEAGAAGAAGDGATTFVDDA